MDRVQNHSEPGARLVRHKRTLPKGREAKLIMDGPSPAAPLASAIRAQLETPFIHKWTIITCIVLGILTAWVIIAFWPRTYRSTAQIMVRVGRESVALDPSATLSGQTLLIQKTREEELVSALDLLASEKVANKAIERIGTEPILNGALPGDEPEDQYGAKLEEFVDTIKDNLFKTLLAAGIKTELSDREASLIELQKSVEVFSPKDSSIISVTGQAETPGMAQAIAQGIADAFVEEHVSLNRPHGTAAFFTSESEELEQKLDKLVGKRASFMSGAKMVSVESSKSILREQLTATKKELLDAHGRADQVKAEIKNADSLLAQIPKEYVNERKQRNNLTRTELQKKLFEVEIEEAKLRETRTENNPELLRLQSELTKLRDQISQEEKDKVDQNYAANPTYLSVENSLKARETQQAGLDSFIARKDAQRQTLEAQIDELLAQEQELLVLNRNIAVAEASLNQLQMRAEQARLVDELSQNKVSNVSIFQPAALKERPASPNKKLVALALPVLGLAFGLAVAFSRELCSTKLRHKDHLYSLANPNLCHSVPFSGRILRRRKPDEAKSVCRDILSSATMEQWDSPVVGVIGASPGCGASTIASLLARESSQFAGITTNLVDADRTRRTVSRMFRHQKSLGLADLVGGTAEPSECIHWVGEGLAVTPAGRARKGSVLKTMGQQNGCVSELGEKAGLVVIDLPPASDSHEATAFASCVDFVVLVLEAEKSTHAQAERLLERLEQGNPKLIGLILNKHRSHLPLLVRKLLFGSK